MAASRRSNPCMAWFQAGLDTWMLGAEASTVVALRMARMSTGGAAAAREMSLMVSEKVSAAMELQTALVGEGARLTPLGGTQTALRHYRRKVAANRARLSR